MTDDHSESLGLTIADHGRAMQAILAKPLNLLARLDKEEGPHPSEEQVLDAATRVQAFDAETKARMKKMRALYPDLFVGKRLLEPDFFEPIGELEERFADKSIAETVSIVTQTAAEENGSVPLATIYDLAARLLADGAKGIYSAQSSAAELLRHAGGAEPIFRAAAIGALSGGASAFTRMGETPEITEAGASAGAVATATQAFVDGLVRADL